MQNFRFLANAYESVRPILEAIAARAMDEPCCAYIGPDGAGHYSSLRHIPVKVNKFLVILLLTFQVSCTILFL